MGGRGIWIRHKNGKTISLVCHVSIHEDYTYNGRFRLIGDDGAILGEYQSEEEAKAAFNQIIRAIVDGLTFVDLYQGVA